MSRLPRLFLLLLLLPLAASAGVYRWLDKDGKVHYSDKPPPPEVLKMEERKLRQNVIDTAGQPYAVQKAATDFPVTLYTGPDCGAACNGARALLKKRGVPFSEVSLVTEEAAAAFRKRAGDGPLLVPALGVGTQVLKGFEEGGWNRQLDEASYPKFASPGAAKPQAAPVAPAGDKAEPKK